MTLTEVRKEQMEAKKREGQSGLDESSCFVKMVMAPSPTMSVSDSSVVHAVPLSYPSAVRLSAAATLSIQFLYDAAYASNVNTFKYYVRVTLSDQIP